MVSRLDHYFFTAEALIRAPRHPVDSYKPKRSRLAPTDGKKTGEDPDELKVNVSGLERERTKSSHSHIGLVHSRVCFIL